jgi:hypothetical protein
MPTRRRLLVGDWVEVRSKAEILRTLDENGRLDGMPFQPEQFAFCGQRFRVFKRAHKTCDPDYRSRRVENAVHLETRCNGQAHGGCQAGCLFFWNEAWLTPVDSATAPATNLVHIGPAGGCSEDVVWDRARKTDADQVSYVCQTTEVQYEKALKWWDLSQYIEDYFSGNITFVRLVSGTIYSVYFNVSQSGLGLGPLMRWFYDRTYRLWGGVPWPRKKGIIPEGQPTPVTNLNLQPGELVRVKPHDEILKTVTTSSKNRGMWWDAELVPYCGKTYRVLDRVNRVLDERSGKMVEMKSPCIILDTVVCQARYSACRMFCPRNTYAYWREIWLERVEAPVASGD